MNQSKKRVKNKQELSPKSGPKKKPQYKTKILFEFELSDGKRVKNGEGRIKVSIDGGVSCLIQTEEGWKAVKAKIISVKLVHERVKLLDAPKKHRRRLPRKSS